MSPQTTVVAHVPLKFSIDSESPPRDGPIHEALRGVRALKIEAPTLERADIYALRLMHELERAGN